MTTKELNEQIKKDYPIQDDTWPSRRWNNAMDEYCDLSGECKDGYCRNGVECGCTSLSHKKCFIPYENESL